MPTAPTMRYIDATLIGTRAAESGRKVYRYRVSSNQRARDGGVIPVNEWRTADFLRHPVILASHNYSTFPIGMAENLTSDDEGLVADIVLHGQNEASREAIAILDAGFPIATSVGFRPESVDYPEARSSDPFTFRGVELLEISLVSVPSDPNALALRGVPADAFSASIRDAIRNGLASAIGGDTPTPDPDLTAQIARLEERIASLEAARGEAGDDDDAPEATPVVALDIDLSKFPNLRSN